MIIAISNLNIAWFLFFGIPGILLLYLPEQLPMWSKKRQKEKTIELETRRKMTELGLSPKKDWQEYYRIREGEEKKLQKTLEE